MATPHYNQNDKTPEISLAKLGKAELTNLCKGLLGRVRELEQLVDVVSRGKYTWEATFDAITEPVLIVRPDYTIDRANLSVARAADQEITKAGGKKCFQYFAGRESPCENCPMESSVKKGERESAPLGNRIHKRDYQANAFPLMDAKGGLEGTILYYRDITEEMRLRQEVIQQEKMAAIGILAGGVAHEVNNPLGGVLAFAQFLLKKLEPGTESYEDVQEIERAATRCKKIVQELLDFSRVSKDKEKCLVHPNTLIEKLMPLIRMEIRSLNIDLQLDLDPNLPGVQVVPNRLQQVFLNLMTNACHAMPQGGSLTIKSRFVPEQNQIQLIFQDTGVGIPAEIRDRIFEPFFTTKDPGKGTGLGLSISYRIVNECGGQLGVESEVGKGATFTVSLPVNT